MLDIFLYISCVNLFHSNKSIWYFLHYFEFKARIELSCLLIKEVFLTKFMSLGLLMLFFFPVILSFVHATDT